MNHGLIMLIVFGFFIFVFVFAIMMISSKSGKKAEQISDLINTLNRIAEKEENPIKKKIINNQIGYLIIKDTENRLKPLIQKYSLKVSKNHKQKWKEQLQQLENELESETTKAQSLHYDIMAELNDEEKECYSVFCDNYKQMCNSERTWIVVSKQRKNNIKASAKFSADLKPIKISSGYFWHLYIPYDVPKIPISDTDNIYIYPHFVVVSNTYKNTNFTVLPINEVNFKHTSVCFHEEGIVPADAELIGTTYKWVNKNGQPDKRYSNNPILSILRYGEITIEPLNITLLFSNNESTLAFIISSLALKTVHLKNIVSEIIIDEKSSRKEDNGSIETDCQKNMLLENPPLEPINFYNLSSETDIIS